LRRLFVIFVFLISVNSCSSTQTSLSSNESATGSSAIFGGNIEQAKKLAIENATCNYIQKQLSGKDKTSFENLRPFIDISETDCVISKTILNEKEEDNKYYIKLKADIDKKKVLQTISEYKEKYSPTILLIIQSIKNDEKVVVQNESFIMLTSKLITEKGYKAISINDVSAELENTGANSDSVLQTSITPQNRQFYLETVGADLILIGDISITEQTEVLESYDTNMKSIRASVNFRSVDVYTGEILAAISENAAGAHIDPDVASQKALEQCLQKSSALGTKDKPGKFLIQTFTQYLNNLSQREYRLVLSKQPPSKFKDELMSVSNKVLSVQLEESSDNSSYNVVFSGTAEDLSKLFTDSRYNLSDKYKLKKVKSDLVEIEL
jgi:hypothetical protein